MASNAVIGALRVVLGADSAALETGLKEARGSLAKFARHASEIAAGIGIEKIAEKLAFAFTSALKQGFLEADKLGKMAQSIGVPVEELSKLKYAADLSGVSLESLAKGLGRLNRNMVEAAQGSQMPIKAFEAMGVSIRNADGSLKTVSQILPEIAERFSKMRDGPEKTAFAMQLLGRAGADLIPMLNGGSKGLRDMMIEAEQLGLVIDTRTGKAAELFNDNLTRMQRVFAGIVTKVTAEILPAFVQFSQVMIDASKNSDVMKTVAEGIVSALRFVVKEVLLTIVGFRQFYAETKAILEGIAVAAANYTKIFTKDFWLGPKENIDEFVKEMARAGKIVAQGFEESQKIGDSAQNFIRDFYANAKATVDAAAPTLSKALAAPFISAVNLQKNAFESMANQLQKQIVRMQAEAQTFGMSPGAAAQFVKTQELLRAAQQANLPITDALRQRIQGLSQDYANASLQADGFRLRMELRTPLQVMGDELRRLDDLVKAGAISWTEYGEAVRRTQARAAQSMLSMASEAAGLFSQIFKDSKSAAIAQALISGAEGVARSLGAYPWPFAGIMAGLHAAAAAAQISRIRSISPSGGGGATRAPAVTTPSETANDQTFTLKGLNPGSMFNRDSIMALVEAINGATKDGVKLRINVA